MKLDPIVDDGREQHDADHAAIAAAAAALFGPAVTRIVRVAPGRADGAWLRESRNAHHRSHRFSALFGASRDRGTTTNMTFWIQVEGRPYQVEVDTSHPMAAANARPAPDKPPIPEAVLRPRPPHRLPEDAVCRTPIAGRVIALLAPEGRAVKRHEPVVLIEAMKMEVPIGPAVDGIVKAIHVEPGQLVAAKQILFDLA